MIKNIIFDFGNVVLKWNTKELIKNYSNEPKEQEILEKVIFKSEEWLKLDNGLLNYDEAKIIFKSKLPDHLKEKVEEIMNTWYTKMPLIEETYNLIIKLKQNNYKIYALSNTHVTLYEYIKNSPIGKYFDGYLISAIEKMMKPNEDIYYRLFEKFKLKPAECFFIDDNKKNILTSRKLGMKGHIFDMNNYQKLKEELNENDIQI